MLSYVVWLVGGVCVGFAVGRLHRALGRREPPPPPAPAVLAVLGFPRYGPWLAVFRCASCLARLNHWQRFRSSGTCPLCGHTGPNAGTIVDTIQSSGRLVWSAPGADPEFEEREGGSPEASPLYGPS